MKSKIILLFGCLLLSIFTGCSDSSSNDFDCDKQSQLVTDAVFDPISTINYNITSVSLNENCLDITLTSSGCDSNNWQMELFSNSDRDLKVKLTNMEACLAVLPKTVSYNLVPLQVSGQHQVTLQLEGWATPVVYNY